MKDLNNITLISVAGVNIEDSLKSLIYSSKDLRFGSIKFIAPSNPKHIENIEYIKCNDMDQNGFTDFMFYKLWKYIETSHCLFVHHDGFIINPECWDDEFLKYDYIGAPWNNFPNLNNRVGNGGFSLRSKKILQKPTELDLKLYLNIEMPYLIEDVNYCNYHFDKLCLNGIKFAPLELAAKFSTETFIKGLTRKSFGFHNFSLNPANANLLSEVIF